MKQDKQSAVFFRHHSAWLAQFDGATLLFKMLDLCDTEPVYLVDKDQQVLYWSLGMEKLSGLPKDEVIGKVCLPEYAITEGSDNEEQRVKISLADGDKVEVKKMFKFYMARKAFLPAAWVCLLPP